MEGTVALLMAGGRGQRMLASGVQTPKPLVSVCGRTLLEHNLHQLLRHGITRVYVSVSAVDPSVRDFVDAYLVDRARDAGAELGVLTEPAPLGNIGSAGLLHRKAQTVLVAFADNLTTLDLRAVIDRHHAQRFALTLATHDQPFRIPYGRLTVRDGTVTGYTEKPTLMVTVCSAVCVLGEAALACLPADRPTGLVDLTNSLLAAGEGVAAFEHDAPWVDVNDADGIRRAEHLVHQHPEAFARTRDVVEAAHPADSSTPMASAKRV